MLPDHPSFHTRLVLFFIACLISAATAQAQAGGTDTLGTGGRHSITGRLIFPSGQRADVRLKVTLESSGFGDISVLSDMNGKFTFQSLKPGNYTVVVDGGELFEGTRESVFIEAASVSGRRSVGVLPISRPFTVQIYLKPKDQPASMKPGVLNAALAGAPKAAADLYLQALESSARGDSAKAIVELKQAVSLYPDFGLALNELGVQYLKRGQVDNAAKSLQSAVRLLPDAFAPHLNYGIALLNQNRFAEAEIEFRDALKKNDAATTAHMYLGIALCKMNNYQEAETELQRAVTLGGERVAQAHYYLGGLYWKLGDYQRAANELEKYLAVEPKATNADRVRTTIKELRGKS